MRVKKTIKKLLPEPFSRGLREARSNFNKLYDDRNNKFYFDLPVGLYEHLRTRFRTNETFTEYEITGEKPDISFLISTNEGLFLYEKGGIRLLLGDKGFYGISKSGSLWYTFHKTGKHGRIISFELDSGRLKNLKTKIWGLSRGIHQIDFIEDKKLLVADTYNNRVILYENLDRAKNRFWRSYTATCFPNGKLSDGRASRNYNHFNSLFKYNGNIYLIAHNETYKTQRKSELYVLDMNLNVKEIRQIDGSNCHNYYRDDSLEMICKSLEGTVLINGRDVLSFGKFTRGLSVADDYYIIGASDIETERAKRAQASAMVYITDKELRVICSIILKNLQIQEIRRVDKKDLSMSNAKGPFKPQQSPYIEIGVQ